MFSHITVGSNDLARAEKFYDAVLLPLGLQRRQVVPDGGPPSACWLCPGRPLPMFYVYEPFDKNAASVGNGSMVAFQARSPDEVDEAYEAGLRNGGTCDGKAGPRARYGTGYYGAYLRDPDGNKIHVVFRGDKEPS